MKCNQRDDIVRTMRVTAIDPGLGTGIATYNDGTFLSIELQRESIALALSGYVRNASVVCIERYVITERTAEFTQQTDALEIIGHTSDLCEQYGIPLKMQTPRDAKAFATDKKLKALGWYIKTKDGHSNDAARHLLLFLVRNKLLSTDDQIKLKSVFT